MNWYCSYVCRISIILILFFPKEPVFAQESNPDNFIDAHVHLNDIQMHLQLMEAHGIEKSVVFWGRSSTNETLIKAAKAKPDKLIPFVSISPERRSYRSNWQNDDVTLLKTLEDLMTTGAFRGIGEINVVHFPSRGFPENDFDLQGKLMTGIMEVAGKYHVPVNIHCEITRLREFSRLLQAYPDVKVIWAHGGYTPYFIAKRMIEQYPHLVYELSARTYSNHPRSPDYTIFRNETEIWPRWLQLIESNPDRFVIGTDGSQRRVESERMKISRVKLLLKQLTPQTRQMVGRENIMKLISK